MRFGFTKFALSLLALLFASVSAFAVELTAWQAVPGAPPIVLPVREGETPSQAARRYESLLHEAKDLKPIFASGYPELEGQEFRSFSGFAGDRALLVANRSVDYRADNTSVRGFQLGLGKSQAFLLPIVANLGLSEEETKDFFRDLSREFRLVIPMGGPDIEPSLYGQDNQHSRVLSAASDRFQFEFLKAYINGESGFVFGVCRGAQLTAAALGYQLFQDIPIQFRKPLAHADGATHTVQVLETPHSIFKNAVGGASEIKVNSYHHQAIQFKSGGPLVLAARSADGVTEVVEFANGRGILMQFHPELMSAPERKQIFEGVRRAARDSRRISCRSLFSRS